MGTHEFVDVQWVQDVPEGVAVSRQEERGYLALEFSSDANLNAEDMNTLYSRASACPYDEDRSFPAFGPFTASPESFDLPIWKSDGGGPVLEYVVYVPVAAEIRGALENGRWPKIGHYDLQVDPSDLCVVMEQVGYPWATRSDPVVVPAQRVARALEDRRRAE